MPRTIGKSHISDCFLGIIPVLVLLARIPEGNKVARERGNACAMLKATNVRFLRELGY
jgi:hypothetical protein